MELDHDTKELLEAVKTYCRLTGRARATVATQVMNDGKFFDRIEAGGGFTTKTKNKVKSWFLKHTPRIPNQDKPKPRSTRAAGVVNTN